MRILFSPFQQRHALLFTFTFTEYFLCSLASSVQIYTLNLQLRFNMARIDDIEREVAVLEEHIARERNQARRTQLTQRVRALRQEQLDLIRDENRLIQEQNRNMEEAVRIIERRRAIQAMVLQTMAEPKNKDQKK
jgi:hypothetical protein